MRVFDLNTKKNDPSIISFD